MADAKYIKEDVKWREDEDHSPAMVFRVEVQSSMGYPLHVKGRYNPLVQKLSFALLHPVAGRIYGLDMGRDHKNPDGSMVGEVHKHRWTESWKVKEAYAPVDITAPVNQPAKVWKQFCVESSISHEGQMAEPSYIQMESFLC